MHVVGVDACKQGWVGIELDDDRQFQRALVGERLGLLIAQVEESVDESIVVVDMPLGSGGPEREADAWARRFVGAQWRSVFPIPPYSVWAFENYDEAYAHCLEVDDRRLNKQTWGLKTKILDANETAHRLPDGVRLYEGHPEVTFRSMQGEHLVYGKRVWAGQRMRDTLLAEAGIELPKDLGLANNVLSNDILDAAALSWTAGRIAIGEAVSFPPGQSLKQSPSVDTIWY